MNADASLAAARALPIDIGRMRATIERLAAIGSMPLGCRLAGTAEDREAAALIADELSAAGLADVALERVRVDAWRFEGASVSVGDDAYDAMSWSGVPGTSPEGVAGRLVDVGTARRSVLDRTDLEGRIALVDWRSAGLAVADLALELTRRGGAAIVVTCPRGGPYFQADGAYGAMPGRWYEDAAPMVLVPKEAASALRASMGRGPVEARVRLRVTEELDADGWHPIGYLDGTEDGAGPIVVGAHHDAWFRGGWDNASGVAVLVELARAMAEAGLRPRHRLCFTSPTGEECGQRASAVDGLVGSWRQISDSHPEWADAVPFHLCIEAVGRVGAPLRIDVPVELAAWSRRLARRGARQGWLPGGWRVCPPGPTTDLWPLLVSGIPGVAAYNWSTPLRRQAYHTPQDTPATVDDAVLGGAARQFALMLLEADRDPDGALDHGARARELAREADGLASRGTDLRRAAKRHAGVRGRAAFGPVGRGLIALADGRLDAAYPHTQAARLSEALAEALAALDEGDARRAARRLERIGGNRHFRHLSEATMQRRAQRGGPGGPRLAWATRSHLTATPVLWNELASLRGEPGSPAVGGWLEASLEAHRAEADEIVTRRVRDMERALHEAQRAGS